jgi:hypothetical protein
MLPSQKLRVLQPMADLPEPILFAIPSITSTGVLQENI